MPEIVSPHRHIASSSPRRWASAARAVVAGAIAAMLVLLVRAFPVHGLSACQIGLREPGYGALAVLLIRM
jgi:hypothetical protein